MKFLIFSIILSLFTLQTLCYIPQAIPVPQPATIASFNALESLGQGSATSINSSSSNGNTNINRPVAVSFTSNGVWVASQQDSRVLFFPNPLSPFSSAATAVLGQSNFTTNDNSFGQLVSIATNSRGWVYASDSISGTIYLYQNITDGGNTQRTPIGITSQMGVYAIPNLPAQLTVNKRNDDLYVADSSNNRVLRFSYNAISNSLPTGVWGQANYADKECQDSTNLTCLNAPGGVAVDCNDGVWVTTRVTGQQGQVYQIYYFPNNSRTATAAFSAPSSLSNDWSQVFQIAFDSTCRHLAVAASSKIYILTIGSSSGSIGEGPTVTAATVLVGGSTTANFGQNQVSTLGSTLVSAAFSPSQNNLFIVDNIGNRVIDGLVLNATGSFGNSSQSTVSPSATTSFALPLTLTPSPSKSLAFNSTSGSNSTTGSNSTGQTSPSTSASVSHTGSLSSSRSPTAGGTNTTGGTNSTGGSSVSTSISMSRSPGSPVNITIPSITSSMSSTPSQSMNLNIATTTASVTPSQSINLNIATTTASVTPSQSTSGSIGSVSSTPSSSSSISASPNSGSIQSSSVSPTPTSTQDSTDSFSIQYSAASTPSMWWKF